MLYLISPISAIAFPLYALFYSSGHTLKQFLYFIVRAFLHTFPSFANQLDKLCPALKWAYRQLLLEDFPEFFN
jgi:hypothetical protein